MLGVHCDDIYRLTARSLSINIEVDVMLKHIYAGLNMFFDVLNNFCAITLSGRIGKVVASHADGCKVAYRIPAVAELHLSILCMRRSGVLPMRVGLRPLNWIYRF